MVRRSPLLLLSTLALFLGGCLPGEIPSPFDNGGVPTTDGPTYYEDIKPLVDTWCVRCHQAGGNGAGDFTQAETVVEMGELLLGAVESGEMPPPVSDPDCADYEGSERLSLPDEQRQLLAEWVEAGKQLGEPESAVEVEPWETQVVDPDLVLTMAHPYLPTFSDEANPGNEYRCFVLENTETVPFYVTELAPVVGTPEIVHHIVVWLQDESSIWSGYDEETGIDCINDVSAGAERMLAGWAPGMMPVKLPEGRGIRVGPEQNLVIQVHYFQNDDWDGSPDQSGYGLKTSPTVEIPLLMAPFGPTDFSIPAGEESYSHSGAITLPAPVSGKLYAAFPHMHILGSGYELTVDGPSGRRCVVRSDGYDFENQITYMLEEPIDIETGDVVEFRCTWNNSESNPDLIHHPPQETFWGERTDEEMCFAFSLFSILE